MCTAAARRHLHLQPALVPAVHLHARGLANHHKVRPHPGIQLHKSVARDAVAPLFHVAKIIRGPAIKQTKVARNRHSVNHARCAALLIAGAARIQHAVLHLAHEWVPTPRRRITNTDRINMRIKNNGARPAANAPENVPHLVKAHFVKLKGAHLSGCPLANRPDLALHRRDCTQLAQKLHNLRLSRHNARLNCRHISLLHKKCSAP